MSRRLVLKRESRESRHGLETGGAPDEARKGRGSVADDYDSQDDGRTRGVQGKRRRLSTGATPKPRRSTAPQPRQATPFLAFEPGLAVARSLGLASQKGWYAWCKEGMCPPDVPRRPDRVYKEGGWQGWGHWLGSGNTKCGTEQFLPYDEALAVARCLGLANQKAWHVWSREGMRPPNVPSNPNALYKDSGWQGWGDWLGTGNQSSHTKQFLTFARALALARSLRLASQKAWYVWCKEGMCPTDVPRRPDRVYKDGGWQGWGHWLGTGNPPGGQLAQDFLPFAEALAVVRSFHLANRDEWSAWCKTSLRPGGVPTTPERVYKDTGWTNLAHWLGAPAALPAAATRPAGAGRGQAPPPATVGGGAGASGRERPTRPPLAAAAERRSGPRTVRRRRT